MCTSIIFSPNDHYFGRNFDYEMSFGQQVVVTPRNYEFKFRKMPTITTHYAMVGISAVREDYPLYFDAANEKGLGMAGLNYAGNAYYPEKEEEGKDNISPFEFIPWILGQCANLDEAKKLIDRIHLVHINFSKKLPLSPLHWLMADKSGKSIVIESDKDGLHVYDNLVGTLTNNPPFPKQLFNLNNYADVSPKMPTNRFSDKVNFDLYSRGLGSHNLPGGMDSESRFVRALFTKSNAPAADTEADNVNNYFHILHAVEQPKGVDEVGPNSFEYTIYSDCTNLEKGLFYYTTYNQRQITEVDMNKEDLEKDDLIIYPIEDKVEFNHEN